MIYVFWTSGNKVEARRVIHGLLEKKLIACASIFPVESIYTWKGKIEESQEVKVFLKSLPKHFEAITSYIQEQSSYETSEILEMKVEKVAEPYLNWIEENL